MSFAVAIRATLALSLMLFVAAAPVQAFDPVEPVRVTHKVVVDVAVARPLAALRLAAGAAAFVVAYPLSLVLGGTEHVVDHCLEDPLHDLVRRPLGKL